MWVKLVKYSDNGHLMGCANHVAATSGNIIRDHAYSILSVYSGSDGRTWCPVLDALSCSSACSRRRAAAP